MLSGGYMLRGLSGGERKRLAIACALVQAHMMTAICAPTPTPAWPMVTQRHADIQDTSHALSLASTVLLCDEPTSGMDTERMQLYVFYTPPENTHTHTDTRTRIYRQQNSLNGMPWRDRCVHVFCMARFVCLHLYHMQV